MALYESWIVVVFKKHQKKKRHNILTYNYLNNIFCGTSMEHFAAQ